MSCRGFLQGVLKLLNFLLAMVGVAMVLYSLWMLNQWHKRVPTPSPAPGPVDLAYYEDSGSSVQFVVGGSEVKPTPLQKEVLENERIQQVTSFFVVESASRLKFSLFPDGLPSPWFIYAFLGAGIIACLTTCTGHIAAETASSCCLSCYTLLLVIVLMLQAIVTATVFFDNHWLEDIPNDPTGELNKIYNFVTENYDICKWTAVTVLVLEVLALLFSLILRAFLGPKKSGYDSDDDYLPRAQRQPRPATAAGNSSPSTTVENRPVRSDEWSKRLREKYGVDTNDVLDPRRFAQGGAASTGEEKAGTSRCSIM